VSDTLPHIDLDTRRQFYAEELRAAANLQSEALVKAFATIPREHFLGPGPWEVRSPDFDWYRTTDADPKHLYHDVLVAIDAERGINNGHPALLALFIDSLELQEGEHIVHVGCGTGYYTAVMAEVVGHNGRVTAIEIDFELAERARSNLSHLPQVEVVQGGGGEYNPGPSDAILVNAGATHPKSVWLDSLRPGGRLLLPLTVAGYEDGTKGGVFKIRRQYASLAVSFISRVAIFPCQGARAPELNVPLKDAFNRRNEKSVQSLRTDTHDPDDTCWLHASHFCLSKLATPK
jgi:protein-L-isoaspartate(D-aspartate) O-methyltransferase